MRQILRRIPKILAPKPQRVCALALASLLFAWPAGAQEARKWNFRATNYLVNATLLPVEQTLQARARVDFEVREASRNLEVELHPNLKVTSVTGADGRPLPFERLESTPLRLRVTLPDVVAPGQKVTLTFDYAGPLFNEENSPVRDTRLASISEVNSYLLLPARWFPLTNYPANRYMATFNITVPEAMYVAGTGKPSAPTQAPPEPAAPPKKGEGVARPSQVRKVFSFRTERPESAGSFVAGNLREVPVNAQGLTIPLYAPASASESATELGQSLANVLLTLSDMFGPLPQPEVALAQLPEGTLQYFSAPGILFLGKRQWEIRGNVRLLARVAAGQWWGNQVAPATPNDAWLADGLARYSEAMYEQQISGQASFNRVLEDAAVGSLAFEDAAPIAQAGRLEPYSGEYRSVVMNKGAMVFHMLREQMGDAAFQELLRTYYKNFAGKAARIEDFQQLAQQIAARHPRPEGQVAPNLLAFFTNWVNSTGIPEFKMDYVIYRIPKGFRIVGKIKQSLETFRMPMELKVETEGNPETKTIEVSGTDSSFVVETFGRPKPGGIILDPNNQLLKSSPKLRVRALIARGEELAESGSFYDAIQEYQRALDLQKNNSLAHFRMGEAFFYQKNYQASANAFREAYGGDLDPSYRWVEVWSHIYLGKIYDLGGQRERAVNEYSKARDLADNTGGAQDEVEKYLKKPYAGDEKPSG
ncbi:MAG TPA: M1 family aminopeptidase [Candidatus Acidoferrales bacterium]|nr:M1 family aminopeptidase [Candidatus Acidoferrales bacterium]